MEPVFFGWAPAGLRLTNVKNGNSLYFLFQCDPIHPTITSKVKSDFVFNLQQVVSL